MRPKPLMPTRTFMSVVLPIDPLLGCATSLLAAQPVRLGPSGGQVRDVRPDLSDVRTVRPPSCWSPSCAAAALPRRRPVLYRLPDASTGHRGSGRAPSALGAGGTEKPLILLPKRHELPFHRTGGPPTRRMPRRSSPTRFRRE